MRQRFGAFDVLSCHAEKLEASPLPQAGVGEGPTGAVGGAGC